MTVPTAPPNVPGGTPSSSGWPQAVIVAVLAVVALVTLAMTASPAAVVLVVGAVAAAVLPPRQRPGSPR